MIKSCPLNKICKKFVVSFLPDVVHIQIHIKGDRLYADL